VAIEAEITVELVRVEVSDTYQVEVTIRDALTGANATVSLSWSQTQDLIDELQRSVGEAVSAFWEDQEKPATVHGFDVEWPMHPECVAGKCGNCDGRTLCADDEWRSCTHRCHAEAAAS